jgi:hypothetical protein
MALQAAADELYGLPPEQFAAARDGFANRLRQAGERELATAVRNLRRPSVSAWLVNVLVRRRGTDLDDLVDIGDHLRSAMARGAGDAVRSLTEDRRTAIARLVADVEAMAGRPVTPGVSEEVRLTLEAATADPTAATAVRSGRLVRPLRYAGFGELPDLAGAVGLSPARPAPAAHRAGQRPKDSAAARAAARQEAERAAHEAAGAADDAQRAYEQRVAEHADAEATASTASETADAAAKQLAAARQAEKSAAAATTQARKAARAAHAAADAARRRLAGLRTEPGTAKRRQ